jgi:DNA-binding NtrC family response regulator
LRERGSDVLLLAGKFLQHFSALMKKRIQACTPAAQQKLLSHHWPGNVRELRNVVERAVILETSHEIQAGSLPNFQLEGRLRKEEGVSPMTEGSLDELMANYERQLISTTLEYFRFNHTKTAEQLKISRHALRYRMQRLNINLGHDDDEPGTPAAGKEAVK